MNNSFRTYGVIINMDYSHHSTHDCKKIWNTIVKSMQNEGFHFDKRMFIMTTTQDRKYVCDKARAALNSIDKEQELYRQSLFNYISDFLTIDMSDYVDLRLPPADLGIVLHESTSKQVSFSF